MVHGQSVLVSCCQLRQHRAGQRSLCAEAEGNHNTRDRAASLSDLSAPLKSRAAQEQVFKRNSNGYAGVATITYRKRKSYLHDSIRL